MLRFFVILASILCGIVRSDNVTDSVFAKAQKRYDVIYYEHVTFVEDGYAVKKGQIGSAEFFEIPLTEQQTTLYNNSLVAVIACVYHVAIESPKLNRKLTNYEKTELCLNLTDEVPLKARCNLLRDNEKCDINNKYRTITGYCNNLENPKWGSQLTHYSRLIPGNFDDGSRSPRKSASGKDLPKPRYLGNGLYRKTKDMCDKFEVSDSNYLAIMFGQLIAHDVGERVNYQSPFAGNSFSACTSDNSKVLPPEHLAFGTVPIEVPPNDPFLSRYGVGCMNFVRTQPIFRNDCKWSGAEFTNFRTQTLDASMMYGSEIDAAAALREFKNGKLKINRLNILPKKENCNEVEDDYDCYTSAETRTTPFYTLAIIHSILIRFHNDVANALSRLNPHWNDEKLYQESRHIVIAVHQHIIYNEWLPIILGEKFTKEHKLFNPKSLYCGKYNSTIDPSVLNEFAHGSFRQFHKNIPEDFNFYDRNHRIYRTVPLHDTDNGPKILETEFDGVLRGLMNDPNLAGPTTFSSTIRNQLFNNFNTRNLGIDLPSIDLFVGRDQGLSPYYMYVEMFYKRKVKNWQDLEVTISKENIEKLKTQYESHVDVDLYVGLALERRDYKDYKFVGPVGKHITAEQFRRSKFGDRFFYCLENGANPFTNDQLKEISEMTFTRLICQVVNIPRALPKAFAIPSQSNKWTSCSRFKSMNLNAWKSKRDN